MRGRSLRLIFSNIGFLSIDIFICIHVADIKFSGHSSPSCATEQTKRWTIFPPNRLLVWKRQKKWKWVFCWFTQQLACLFCTRICGQRIATQECCVCTTQWERMRPPRVSVWTEEGSQAQGGLSVALDFRPAEEAFFSETRAGHPYNVGLLPFIGSPHCSSWCSGVVLGEQQICLHAVLKRTNKCLRNPTSNIQGSI